MVAGGQILWSPAHFDVLLRVQQVDLIERPVARLLQAQQLGRRGYCQGFRAHFHCHPWRGAGVAVAAGAALAGGGAELAVVCSSWGGDEGGQLVAEDEFAVLDKILRHHSLGMNYF